MCNSFSSSIWMFPFSRRCDAKNKYGTRFLGNYDKDESAFVCDEEEYSVASSGWPVDVVKVEVPENLGEHSSELFWMLLIHFFYNVTSDILNSNSNVTISPINFYGKVPTPSQTMCCIRSPLPI